MVMSSLFFIPASRTDFIKKMDAFSVDYLIFDLEDAVSDSDLRGSLENLERLDIKENFFVRPRISFLNGRMVEVDLVKKLLGMGFKSFVLPKISTLDELELFANVASGRDVNVCLLVENPKMLLNLEATLESRVLNIVAVGLGSHDYCNVVGARHSRENLLYPRQHLLTVAKAYNVMAVDIASMNIESEELFEQECIDAHGMGFDAKFILHPRQLNVLNHAKYFTKEEVEEAFAVFEQLKGIEESDFSIVKVGERIFEKAHIRRIKNIVEWSKNNDR